MRTLQFFFDVVSPYAWLGWHELSSRRAQLRAELEVEVEPLPTLFGVLLDVRGGVGPAEIPEKRAYTFRDVQRCAKLAGLRLAGPPRHPFNPLKALRLCAALGDREARFGLAGRLLDAAWSQGRDLEQDETLRDALVASGLAPELLDSIATAAVKQQLRAHTDRALELGIFGVPSFVVGTELFWGHDRVPHVEAFLRGELALDEALLADVLARPRGAERARQPAQRPPRP
jgi:2-hydroxychromene-2-carboxylate isomerase